MLQFFACSGANTKYCVSPKIHSSSHQRFTGTLDKLEEELEKGEYLNRMKAYQNISLEMQLTKIQIGKHLANIKEQEQTMNESCRNTKESSGGIQGVSGFGIRVAGARTRAQNLGLND